jgi:hypothetical protein
MSGHPFIGLEGERGGRVIEGNGRQWWYAMMVVEATVSGGDRPRWWGVRGGAPAVLGVEGGHREAMRVHKCEVVVVVAASAVRLGEEDDQAGPTCRHERAGWLAGLAKGRGPVVGGGGPMGGEREVGRPG